MPACTLCQRPTLSPPTCTTCTDAVFDGLNACDNIQEIELGVFAAAASETLPNGASGAEARYPSEYYYRAHSGRTRLRCGPGPSATPWERARQRKAGIVRSKTTTYLSPQVQNAQNRVLLYPKPMPVTTATLSIRHGLLAIVVGGIVGGVLGLAWL